MIFRAPTMPEAIDYLGAMVNVFQSAPLALSAEITAVLTPFNLIALAIGGLVFLLPREPIGGVLAMQTGTFRVELGRLAYTAFAGVIAAILVLTSNFSPFLYFQF